MKSAREVGVLVGVEGVLPAFAEVAVDAVDGQVHLGEAPGALVGLLAVDGDVVPAAAMREHELLRLDEHAAGPAARVVDPAGVWLQNLDQESDHDGRRIELAAALALSAGEFLQEVLVDLAEDVAGGLVAVAGEAGVADEVDQFAEAALVHVLAVEDLRQHAGQ